MARIFQNSYEVNSITAALDGFTFAGTPTIDATVAHTITGSDTRSMRISGMTSATAMRSLVLIGLDGAGPYYLGQSFGITAWPSADNTVIMALDLATTGYVALKIGSTGLLKLFNQTTEIGSHQLSLNTWHHVVLYLDKTPADGSEVLRVYVDGVLVIQDATLTLPLDGMTFWLQGGNLLAEAQTTGSWYFDDMAANTTTDPGAGQEIGLPNQEYMVGLWPSGTGTTTNWTRGGADSGVNYGQVDENPHNDDTDYNTSNTLNQEDTFAMTDPTFSSTANISMCQMRIRRRGLGTVSNATYVSVILLSGSRDESAGLTDANDVYDIAVTENSYVQPGTSTAWTTTALAATEIGYRLSVVGTTGLNITNVRLTVAFWFTPDTADNLLLLGVS